MDQEDEDESDEEDTLSHTTLIPVSIIPHSGAATTTPSGSPLSSTEGFILTSAIGLDSVTLGISSPPSFFLAFHQPITQRWVDFGLEDPPGPTGAQRQSTVHRLGLYRLRGLGHTEVQPYPVSGHRGYCGSSAEDPSLPDPGDRRAGRM
ncbi:uncharacterized protein N7459_002274 [Penicillium hispanicum]|uniref:uncharacterized protein n=1 Tax=Penicillium hispanicum TaxID=1080232 RepID=UPI0025423EB9|nr:uncharacterized protein N7459_002274 [Penicillium hispanicum]KAJ5591905.1 hypothetical protein N7459_002274 [Penicillium hispanicum]